MENKDKLFDMCREYTGTLEERYGFYNLLFKFEEEIKKEAQKELLLELKQDYAEGNPAEEICMKFIDKLEEVNKE